MRFEVLGPLRIVVPVDATGAAAAAPERSLGGPKPRLVLALLLASPNTTLSIDRLIDGLWGHEPPDSARHTLQSYVSELRKAVGDVIERDGLGYLLRVDATQLDALELEERVSTALPLVERDPAAALSALDDALALWRGRPYEEHPDQSSLQVEAERLEELRLGAVEARGQALLALGEPVRALQDLDRLVRDHPYREELTALRMLALYRSGRQADALRAFQGTRVVLAEELGIEPSPRLRRLEEQILLQDPDLDPRVTVPRGPMASSRLENPYMGLRAFREADAARFYGQEALVSAIVERLHGRSTFTAVVGPSGSGKSSAVQAGVLPRLRTSAPEARVALMQPGAQPFAELAAALASAAPDHGEPSLPRLKGSPDGLLDVALPRFRDGERLVLVVDQFEELFTLVEPDEAAAFIAALVRAAEGAKGRLQVLVTMRADFYDRPLADPALGNLFARNVVNVVPLAPEQLEAAATLPARQLDVGVEPRLIGRLIADVAGQPNALPLFQYALTEVFDERSGPVLDLATYERVGGVRKAVARRAESIYSGLDRHEQEAARQLFLRIATVSGDAIGRRRVPAAELTALSVDVVALQSAIDALARYRLLALDRDPTTGAPTVEVAHEALLGEWHRVRDWIEEHREDLATHARFVVALHEWESAGHDQGYLLSGTRLDDYEAWAAGTAMRFTAAELTFLEESARRRDDAGEDDRARAAHARRLQRRTRWQLVALFVAVAVLSGVLAYPVLTGTEPQDRVSIALSSHRDDNTFDELIARGLERSAADNDMQARILEPPYDDPAQALRDLAAESRLVFGTREMWDGMTEVAESYPKTAFVFLDYFGAPQIPNGVTVTFAHEQGSFLVGAAAALESKTGTVGYIGANSSPLIEAFRAGFEQGAKAADPNVEVVSSLIRPDDVEGQNGYQDAQTAEDIATWMYKEQGVDVIYTAAGGSGSGSIAAATDLSDDLGRQLWSIGVDVDQLFDLPPEQRDHVLTSMVKRLDRAIERVVASDRRGELRVPSSLNLGVADDAVGYSTSGDHMQPTTLEALARLEDRIARGDLVVSATPTGPLTEPP